VRAPGRQRLRDGHDRDAGGLRRLADAARDRRDRLAVVEEHAHLAVAHELRHRRDGGRGGLGPVLDRACERRRREVPQAGRVGQVAGHRLRVRNRGAGARAPDRRDRRQQRGEAAVEARERRVVLLLALRVGLGERALDPGGECRQPRHVVPEVRVRILAGNAEQVGDHHELVARSARGGRLELVHERVVAEPVLDRDLRPGDGEVVLQPGLEQVRVGVRIGEDRGDVDAVAAELPGDVPVGALGGDDVEPRGARAVAAARAGEDDDRREYENGSQTHRRVS